MTDFSSPVVEALAVPSDNSVQPVLSVLTSVYKGESYLPGFFENVTAQTFFPNLEVVFVLNQPSRRESQLVASFQARFPDQVNIIEVPQVENVGASWNRALAVARGDFLAVWNVDDTRRPHSFELQVEELRRRPDSSIVFGDYLIVPSYGSPPGYRWRTPRFNRSYFARSIPQGGAFLVWRRSMQDAVGGFDEQLQATPDFDFSLRAVLNGYRMCRIPGILGCFLNDGAGLSTRDDSRRTSIEATLLHVRYGVFDKVRPQNLPEIQTYRTSDLLISGGWHSLSDLYAWYDDRIASRQYLWKVNSVRVFVVALLKRIRLYKFIDFLRDRIFRINI